MVPRSFYARLAAIFLASGAAMGCEEVSPIGRVQFAGAFDPQTLDFGEVTVGTTKRISVDLKNTGPIAFTVEKIENPMSYGMYGDAKSSLVGVSVAPGDSKVAVVEFVVDEEGTKSGEFLVTVGGGELVLKLPVTGIGVVRRVPEIVLEPTSLDFGMTEIGAASPPKTITFTNRGNGPGTIEAAKLGSTSADVSATDLYRLQGVTFPLTIAEGMSVEAQVTFHPTAAGGATDRITFQGAAPQTNLTLDLIGAGNEARGGLVCTPGSLDFGRVERGMPQSQTVTCEARGGQVRFVSSTIDGAAASAALFAIPMPPPANSDIAAGSNVRFFVEFRPDGLPATHNARVAVQFMGARGLETVYIPITGTVIPPPTTNTAVSVVLTWTTQSDIDTHFLRPGGSLFANDSSDCYFGEMNPDWGVVGDTTDNPFLDVDDVDGGTSARPARENINLAQTAPGRYAVTVHYWRGLVPTRATVEVFVDGVRAGQFDRVLGCDDAWTVGHVDWNGTTGTFAPSTQVTNPGRGVCF